MTDVTAERDRLDAAVLEIFRSMDVPCTELSAAFRVIEAAGLKACAEAAARTGTTVASLLADEDFDPLPLSRLYLAAQTRQREILTGQLERYMDSRSWETDATRSIPVDAADGSPGPEHSSVLAPGLTTRVQG
jgi:hypothetical protein